MSTAEASAGIVKPGQRPVAVPVWTLCWAVLLCGFPTSTQTCLRSLHSDQQRWWKVPSGPTHTRTPLSGTPHSLSPFASLIQINVINMYVAASLY